MSHAVAHHLLVLYIESNECICRHVSTSAQGLVSDREIPDYWLSELKKLFNSSVPETQKRVYAKLRDGLSRSLNRQPNLIRL